jgi:uncharacterized protein (DUF488 family)
MDFSPAASETASTPRGPGPAERLFTVGHSNLEPEAFLGLLLRFGVTAVADVRSRPFSRRLPHFNQGALEGFLKHHGIAYVFLGAELGGRPASAGLYDPGGWADYERIRETAPFRAALERLVGGLDRFTVALMCGEEDPLHCHRGLMIAPALQERGLPPRHIRKGGRLETTPRLEARLQQETGLGGLFRESLQDAYRVMNRRKAFRLNRDAEEAEF